MPNIRAIKPGGVIIYRDRRYHNAALEPHVGLLAQCKVMPNGLLVTVPGKTACLCPPVPTTESAN